MINVEINGKLVGQCESAGKASSPLFKDVIDPWIEIRGFTASSPSLTDDQQEVLEWLQIYADKDSGDKPFQTIFFLWDCIKSNNLGNDELTALRKLTRAEQFQVLAAFAEWGSSNLWPSFLPVAN